MTDDLERLYQEAKAALKAKEYNRAGDLLRQILVVDENYKDASRLLAQSVRLKRRRWHNDPRLWGMLGAVLLIGLGIVLAPKAQKFYASQFALPAGSPTATPPPTAISTATATLLPTPTSIPLTWKRIALGQEFPRDTVTAFASDTKDPDVIYAGMKNAGVYKTIDGGLSWRPAHQGLSNTQVESLLIEPENPRTLYAGTMAGVFKTADGGDNWHRLGQGTYLLMDYQNHSRLYARDDNGIYESTDQGNNWAMVHPLNKECPRSIMSWAIHPANGNTLLVGSGEGCELGLYQSLDGGHSWKIIKLKDQAHINRLAIASDQPGNYAIYADYYINPTSEQLDPSFYKAVSTDGGTTWKDTNVVCDVLIPDLADPSRILCATVEGPVPQVTRLVHTAAGIYQVNGASRIVLSGTRFANHINDPDGIFISPDGGLSWAERNGGVGSARAELRLDPTDNSRIYLAAYYPAWGWAGDYPGCTLYRSKDSGENWQLIHYTDGWCGPTFDKSNVLYMMEAYSWQKSWDGGDRWLWSGLYGETYFKSTLYLLPTASQSLSANPYVEGLIYAVGNNVFYSEDSGRTWKPGTDGDGLWDARLFYGEQGQTLYAVGRYHQAYSTDNGKSWQDCGEDITTSRTDSRLALDAQGSHLYLATPGQGVMVSTDACRSWQSSNEGLGNLFVNTIALDPNTPKILYAGTDGGAYVSFDDGQSWGQVNDGLLGATVVYSIAVDKDSNVYAATPYGIFKLEGK